MLAHKSINIATMQLYRSSRGGDAVMVIECDQEIHEDSIRWLEHLEGICKVTYLNMNHTKEASAFVEKQDEMKVGESIGESDLPEKYQGKQGM